MQKFCITLCLLMASVYFSQQIPGKCQVGKYGERWIVGENIGILECKTDDSWHYRGLALQVKDEELKNISFYWKFGDDVDIWETNMFFICRKNEYGEYEKIVSADFANEYYDKALNIIYEKAQEGDVLGILIMKKE